MKLVSQLEIDNSQLTIDNSQLGFASEGAAKNDQLSISNPLADKELIPGIPVLDNDTVAVASSKTKVYVVPGVKKESKGKYLR